MCCQNIEMESLFNEVFNSNYSKWVNKIDPLTQYADVAH